MNLILFEDGEFDSPLPHSDPRAQHLKKVLKRDHFEDFDAGIINGQKGKAKITGETEKGLNLEFIPQETPPPLPSIILAVGAGRPQTAKKILKEITALGVSQIHFFGTELGEKAYLNSSIYKEESYKPFLIEGAQQAFCTRLPDVKVHYTLKRAVETLISEGNDPNKQRNLISACLDNYEAEASLKSFICSELSFGKGRPEVILWIGSERGWSSDERNFFREKNINLVSMGKRVLRTETASVTGVSLCLAEMGLLD
ncbi:MAG: RsmE family RNA methyltransferase [Spirochaetales bacterium]|nr:RsmE family RNA methyltransferase [Spirochaetales bacterium]